MKRCLVVAIACGCAGGQGQPSPAVPAVAAVAAPDVTAAPVAAAAAGPRTLALETFPERTLARSDAPAFAAGTVKKRAVVHHEHGVAVWGVFPAAHRVVLIETAGGKRHYALIDAATGALVAPLDEVVGRLSAGELVVARGDKQVVVRVADGSVVAPEPRLPSNLPATAIQIVSSTDTRDVWLMATAHDHTFVGLWNDRAVAPALADEVPTPPVDRGYSTRPLTDGLELGWEDLPNMAPPPCPTLRLHPHAAPECRQDRQRDLERDHASVGTWDLELVEDDPSGSPRAVATDRATGAQEQFTLGCATPFMLATPARDARAVLACHTSNPAQQLLVLWSPGHARVFANPGEHSNAGHGTEDPQVLSVAAFEELVHPTGEAWLDLAKGVALRGPTLEDLTIQTGRRFVAFSGTKQHGRAVIVDADAATLRDAGAIACPGELLANGDARYTVVSCGLQTQPGLFDFVIQWTKVFDLDAARVYDMPGYVEAVLGDGTALISNRTHYAEESLPTGSELAIVELR